MKFLFFTCKFVGNNFIANRIMESWAPDGRLYGGRDNGSGGGGGGGGGQG